MDKITTTLRKYFNDNDIREVEHPVENIIFVESYDNVFNRRFAFFNYHFRNCEFKLYSAYSFGICFINCTFENCVFYKESIFASFTYCVFRNCTFPDGFKSAFHSATSFFGCDYDDGFLESLSKEMACPSSGEFVGWKKAYLCHRVSNGFNFAYLIQREVIVKLLVPEDSKRSSALSNKCRCEKAKVLEIQDIDGVKIDIPEDCFVVSMYEFKPSIQHLVLFDSMNKVQTQYIPGKMVYPNKFDPDPLVECGGGIHFFMTRAAACEYVLY